MAHNSLRIGLISPRYAPAVGGVERHVEELGKGLIERGFDVEVITTDPTGRLPGQEVCDGVPVRRFRTVGGDGVYFLAPSLGAWLLKNASRFDLLHAHSYHTPLALQTAIASWHTGTPFIVTPHYHGTGHSHVRRLLHVPYRPIGKWLIRRAEAVVCVSRAECDLIRSHFGDDVPCRTIPNGVALNAFWNAKVGKGSTDEFVVLCVGRLEDYKRVDRLIDALPYLPPSASIAIVGVGRARHGIEKRAKKLGVLDRVLFLGQLPQEQLLKWFRTADVFASLSAREAFGLTLLESAASGAAVVASDIPAHREVAGMLPPDRVVLVREKCEPMELAAIIRRAHVSRHGLSAIDCGLPTWDQMVSRVAQCYVDVLEGTNGVAGQEDVP